MMTNQTQTAAPASPSAADLIGWWGERANGAKPNIRATATIVTEVFDHLAAREYVPAADIDVRAVDVDRLLSDHATMHWAALAESTRVHYSGHLRRGIAGFLQALNPQAVRPLRTRSGTPAAHGGTCMTVDLPVAGHVRIVFDARPTRADVEHVRRVLAALPVEG